MKNKTIKQIIETLEYANIQVSEYKENKKLCGYELNTYTDAGVNMILFLDFRDTKKDPKNAKDFIEMFNDRVNDIDIEEEIKLHSEDKRYMQEIGYEVGLQDFKDWKENLSNIFSTKTAQQRQFEQVTDKLRSHLKAMEDTLEMMPIKGESMINCQRLNIQLYITHLTDCINGIKLEDFTPNEYSNNFKLSYS